MLKSILKNSVNSGKPQTGNAVGNPEPSSIMKRRSRIPVKCSTCGKVITRTPYEFSKNTSGNFYCSKECLKIGHSKRFAGSNGSFFGRKHTDEALQKMTGKNHWNYGNNKHRNKICPQCGRTFHKRTKYCCADCSHKARRDRVIKPCAWCGKPVEKVACYKERENFFCSIKCRSRYKSLSNRIYKTCEYCGKEYTVIACRTKRNHYCSFECYVMDKLGLTPLEIDRIKTVNPKWRGGKKLSLICEYCGKRYETSPRRFLQGQRFCSQSCYIQSEIWNGGSSFDPYDENFNHKLKEAIRKRDNYECQICGAKENGKHLHIHHIDYDKKNSSPLNLITLCNSCHSKTNSNREDWTSYFQTYQSNRKGATTIPQGSTLQANGNGSAEHPLMDDDIVYSHRNNCEQLHLEAA